MKVLILAIPLLLPGWACAEGVGDTLQVSSSGSEPPGVFSDGFESGGLGAPEGGSWSNHSAEVTDRVAHSGRYSVRLTWPAKATGGDAWAHLTAGLAQEIEGAEGMWAEGFVYFPDGTEGLGPKVFHREQGDYGHETWKLFRAYHTPYGGDAGGPFGPAIGVDLGLTDGQGGSFLEIPFMSPGGVLWGGWKLAETFERVKGLGGILPLGQWIQLRFQMRESSCSTCYDGLFRMWVDGRIVYDIDTIYRDVAYGEPKAFWGETYHTWDSFYFFQYSNAGFDEETYTFVDDVRAGPGDPPW